VYAWNNETFGPDGTLGRADTREVVLTRDLRAAVAGLNPELPSSAVEEAVATLTRTDFTRSRCFSTTRSATASSATARP